jgi:hypothetical protein
MYTDEIDSVTFVAGEIPTDPCPTCPPCPPPPPDPPVTVITPLSGFTETFVMVPVAGGTFTMGCLSSSRDGNCYDDEKPYHSVTLSDFHIGK